MCFFTDTDDFDSANFVRENGIHRQIEENPEKTAVVNTEHVLLSVELRYGDACLHNTKYRLVYSGMNDGDWRMDMAFLRLPNG